MNTINPTDRNPDVDLDNEPCPEGCCIVEGKLLQNTARYKRIPFGVATKESFSAGKKRRETVGLVIRLSDKAAFLEAMDQGNKGKGIKR